MSEQTLAELLYSGLPESFTKRDASGHLRLLCEGLMAPLELTWSVIAPTAERAGWEKALDPDECPASWLPWLAQFVGVEVTPEMSEQQIREEIKAPTGWRRGQPEPLRTAIRSSLKPVVEGEELLVIIHPNVPETGKHYIRTLLSQTPEPARTEALIRSKLPWWSRLEYEAISGVTVADVAASTKWTTVAELAAKFSTVQALTEILPTEL